MRFDEEHKGGGRSRAHHPSRCNLSAYVYTRIRITNETNASNRAHLPAFLAFLGGTFRLRAGTRPNVPPPVFLPDHFGDAHGRHLVAHGLARDRLDGEGL